MNKAIRTQFSFTLVEMLVVVAVIAILATMVIGIASRVDNQAKEKGMEDIFVIIESALEEYKDYRDNFPDTNDVNPNINCEILYQALDSIPASRNILRKINDKLIKDEFVSDPPPASPRYEIYDLWGTVLDYRYIAGDNFPSLKSAGPDRTFGTPDDISNK